MYSTTRSFDKILRSADVVLLLQLVTLRDRTADTSSVQPQDTDIVCMTGHPLTPLHRPLLS
jgi:hypothetical protein